MCVCVYTVYRPLCVPLKNIHRLIPVLEVVDKGIGVVVPALYQYLTALLIVWEPVWIDGTYSSKCHHERPENVSVRINRYRCARLLVVHGVTDVYEWCPHFFAVYPNAVFVTYACMYV